MSVMPVFRGRKGMLFCTWKMQKNGKKWKNRIDNIAGGGILNNGNNKKICIILQIGGM